MRPNQPSLVQAARQLAAALQRETGLARTGALQDVTAAGVAKCDAFAAFKQACAARDPSIPPGDAERSALLSVIQAADESALVLEAVQSTLGSLVESLQNVVKEMADSGTYHPVRPASRHVGALHLNAEV